MNATLTPLIAQMRFYPQLIKKTVPIALAVMLSLVATQTVFSQPLNLPQEKTIGELELVHPFEKMMPTGITLSQSQRQFVNFPRWGDDVPFTVAEIRDGELVPYPNLAINQATPEKPADSFLSVQSVVVDPKNRLWVLDTGRIEFSPSKFGGPKLVGIDLNRNEIFQKILLPRDVALETTYLNDVRFNLQRGEAGMAFITDSSSSGSNGIIVVDLATGESWRRLHNHASTKPEKKFLPIVEGQPLLNRPATGDPNPFAVGADGIAMGGEGKRLYYCPLSSRTLYSVSIDALVNRNLSDEAVADTVINHGGKGASDGLESDDQNRIYITDYENNAIHRRSSDGQINTLVHDPRILWPDTLALSNDGYLYFTANQLHRQPNFHQGKDLREKPYSLFRIPVDAQPVQLR
ncbi:MAG: L-dopachrome tautomerase-related protein [Halothece sp.]